jgi:hypothetical protein
MRVTYTLAGLMGIAFTFYPPSVDGVGSTETIGRGIFASARAALDRTQDPARQVEHNKL